jgi:hypothetical protein
MTLYVTNSDCCSQLTSELRALRMRGILRPGQDGMRTCARCRKPFGRIFNTGRVCLGCRHRVCDECRRLVRHAPGRRWQCVYCVKLMQVQARSIRSIVRICIGLDNYHCRNVTSSFRVISGQQKTPSHRTGRRLLMSSVQALDTTCDELQSALASGLIVFIYEIPFLFEIEHTDRCFGLF